eukprot:gene23465-biopygen1258
MPPVRRGGGAERAPHRRMRAHVRRPLAGDRSVARWGWRFTNCAGRGGEAELSAKVKDYKSISFSISTAQSVKCPKHRLCPSQPRQFCGELSAQRHASRSGKYQAQAPVVSHASPAVSGRFTAPPPPSTTTRLYGSAKS